MKIKIIYHQIKSFKINLMINLNLNKHGLVHHRVMKRKKKKRKWNKRFLYLLKRNKKENMLNK